MLYVCMFRNIEEETVEHLFFSYRVVDFFWKEVLSRISLHSNYLNEITLSDVLFGKLDIDTLRKNIYRYSRTVSSQLKQKKICHLYAITCLITCCCEAKHLRVTE